MKKRILSIIFAAVICLSVPVVAFAASESICDGNGTWHGGFTTINDEEYIYSKICDNVEDGYRYNGTVWAKNDKGHKKTLTSYTTDKGNAGAFQVTQIATHETIFANKCGYKDVTRTRI